MSDATPYSGSYGTSQPTGQPSSYPPFQGMPPAGQMPPFSGSSAAQNLPGMPLLSLSGGMKFGWLLIGLFMGLLGILLAWLTNAHNFPQARNDAVKFALFGFLISFVISVVMALLIGSLILSIISSFSSAYYYYY